MDKSVTLFSFGAFMPARRAFFTHWLPPLIWMLLIFIGSTGALSAGHTSRFVVPFLRWWLGADFTMEKAEFVHFLIRKLGHLSEYAVLSVLTWRALGSWSVFAAPEDVRQRFITAVMLALLYATSDEYHQSFMPTRTASSVDVAIDTVGALLGLTLFLLVTKRYKSFRQRQAIKLSRLPDRS